MSDPGILVVDDHEDMAAGIAMLLQELPAEVETAFSAEEGIERMASRRYDLVLSDIRMPGMNGLELLGVIRERCPETRVVLLTAHGSIDSAVEAMKSGATDYLTKPFKNDSLLAVVKKALAGDPDAASNDAVDATEGDAVDGRGLDAANARIVGDIAAVLSTDDLVPSLNRALELLRVAAGADDCELFLREPVGGDLLLVACQGPDRELLCEQTRFSPGSGYPGIVVASRTPILTRTLGGDSRYLRHSVIESAMRAYVCVPVASRSGVLGSLHVMSRDSSFDLDAAAKLLDQVAVPLSNAIAAGLATVRESIDLLSGELADELTEETLRSILQGIRKVAGAQSGTLTLLDRRTGVPSQIVSTGATRQLCAGLESGQLGSCHCLPAGHGFAPTGGRREWPEPCRKLPARVSHPCCLPLIAQDRILGMVGLDYGRKAPPLATSVLVPLLAMAQQAALQLQRHHAGRSLSVGTRARPTNEPSLQVRCLGAFELVSGGQSIAPEAFSRSKALTLLKLLAVHAGKPMNRDALAEQLWPGVDPKSGINRLHGVIHAARSVIEPHRGERRWIHLCNQGDVYHLNTEPPNRIDLLEFRDNLAQAERGERQRRPLRERIAHLEAAANLYRGDLFEDDPYAEWCEVERGTLRDQYLAAVKLLALLHERQGSRERAIDWLRRALKCDPLREDVHQDLIQLLIKQGRRSDALAQFEECARLLETELEATPLPQTLRLRDELLDSLG